MGKAEATTNMTIRLRSSLLQRVRQRARERQTSANRIVEEAVERLVGGQPDDVYIRLHELAKASGLRVPSGGVRRFTRDELHEDE